VNILNFINTINTLKDFGFTEYEGKVYIALLEEHPLNGNAIALKSGVPGPKVYETLKKMKDKRYVFEVSDGENQGKKRYSPLPYKDLLDIFKKALTNNIDTLSQSFEELEQKNNDSWTELYHISGYETSINVVRNSISEAENEIIMSCWSQELEKLFHELKKAQDRGVHVVTIIFDDSPFISEITWRTFKHYKFPTVEKRHYGELSCVIDANKVIVLNSLEKQPHAVVSSHQAMVKTTRNYIRHDIYVNRIMEDFSEIMKDKYGERIEKLIEDF
jgi:HTH-type transcriptional regulator, sugar sensing transcriptional regulator